MSARASILLALGFVGLTSMASGLLVDYLTPADTPGRSLLAACAALAGSAIAFAAAWIALEARCLSDVAKLREYFRRKSMNLPAEPPLLRTGEFSEIAAEADRMLSAPTRKSDPAEVQTLQDDLLLREFLLNLAQDPICLVDRNQTYVWANNAYLLRLGLTREELIGKTWDELRPDAAESKQFPPPPNVLLLGRESPATTDETGVGDEIRSYEIHCAAYAARLPEKETAPTHAGAVYRDITKRRRAERTALQNSEQLALMLESISSILIVLDGENVVAHWNAAAARVFGLDAGETVGRPLQALGLGWPAESLARHLTKCRRQGEALRIESLPYHPRGQAPKALGLTLNPSSHGGPNKNAVLILGNDITDIQTRQMRALHEQKMHSIGQLAAGVAHEINTPARFVSNNIRFLKEGFDDLLALLAAHEKLAEKLRAGRDPGESPQQIKTLAQKVDLEFLLKEIPPAISQSLRGMERVSRILQTLKQFSHPGATPKQPVDVNQAVENTCLVTRGEWKHSSELVLDLEPGLPFIMAMPVELNQALLNVVLNAAHANEAARRSREGFGQLIVQTKLDDDMEHVLIRISDTGPGIDPANADKLFNLFYTTKAPGLGTGQGLSIARSIVETQHDGAITFENRPEGGAAFTIKLPAGSATGPETAR
jgi:PAS domain S-box-containing protein